MATDFLSKCDVLSEVWQNYRYDDDYEDFVEYNDLGLPLAFAISQQIIEVSEEAKIYIEEAFELLLKTLGIKDKGFSTFSEMLDSKTKKR